jgi:hypothetical protein
MSGSTYSTLSMTIPLFNFLVDHVEDTIGDEESDENDDENDDDDNDDDENDEKIEKSIKKAAKSCREKLLKYYNKTNNAYLIAVILDPRLKMQYFKDEEWDDELINEINQKYVFLNIFVI